MSLRTTPAHLSCPTGHQGTLICQSMCHENVSPRQKLWMAEVVRMTLPTAWDVAEGMLAKGMLTGGMQMEGLLTKDISSSG